MKSRKHNETTLLLNTIQYNNTQALAKLKEAHKAQDIAGIDAATNELNTVFQAASQEMYNAQNAQGGQAGPQDFGGQQQSSNDNKQGDVTDVDFEEVK